MSLTEMAKLGKIGERELEQCNGYKINVDIMTGEKLGCYIGNIYWSVRSSTRRGGCGKGG